MNLPLCAVVSGVAAHRLGLLQEVFALEVPHEHLAVSGRGAAAFAANSASRSAADVIFDCIAQPSEPIARLTR